MKGNFEEAYDVMQSWDSGCRDSMSSELWDLIHEVHDEV